MVKRPNNITWLFICIFLFIAGSVQIKAQQVPLYSQYMMNGFLLNPAIAGAEGYTAINLTAREQWVGLANAPSTYALSYQTRILRRSHISQTMSIRKRQRYSSRSGKVGIGGYIFSDRNGAIDKTGFKMSYAYHIRFKYSQLSFGLAMTMFQLRLNENVAIVENEMDPVWLNSRGNVYIPDADFGVYYDTRDYYVGISTENLLESTVKLGDAGFDKYSQQRHYYLMGGYDFTINDRLILSPSTLLKFSESMAIQGDFSVKAYMDETYWAGFTYRTGNTLILLAGISIDKYIFGYAFDLKLGSLIKNNFGTHEFMFAVKFGDSARRYRWLNRY